MLPVALSESDCVCVCVCVYVCRGGGLVPMQLERPVFAD